jgi:hypothetical protein
MLKVTRFGTLHFRSQQVQLLLAQQGSSLNISAKKRDLSSPKEGGLKPF